MSRTPSPWVLGARSETGYVRSANEDRMGWTRTGYGDVFVVADGMGGYRGGGLAAEITVRTLQEQLAAIPPGSERFTDHVRSAFIAANHAVYSQRQTDDPATREMGATGLALVSDGTRFIVAHVGDSRAYLWRRGVLRQLTRDHTRVQSMVDSRLLTPEQAAVHPDASVLDRAMGHQPTVEVDVTDWMALEPGDTLLLCSDGLCGYVGDAEIAAILAAGDAPQRTTDRLIDCALGTGGHDNVTVQLVRFDPTRPGILTRAGVLLPASLLVTAVAAFAVGLQFGEGRRPSGSASAAASAPASPPLPASPALPASASSSASRPAIGAPAPAPVPPSPPPASAPTPSVEPPAASAPIGAGAFSGVPTTGKGSRTRPAGPASAPSASTPSARQAARQAARAGAGSAPVARASPTKTRPAAPAHRAAAPASANPALPASAGSAPALVVPLPVPPAPVPPAPPAPGGGNPGSGGGPPTSTPD